MTAVKVSRGSPVKEHFFIFSTPEEAYAFMTGLRAADEWAKGKLLINAYSYPAKANYDQHSAECMYLHLFKEWSCTGNCPSKKISPL